MGPDPVGVLNGRRIIITRSVADNESLGAALRRLGADVVEVPLVEVLPPVDGGAELCAAAERLDDYRWIVLTSVNAVDAMVGARTAVETEPHWPNDLTAAVVGPSTAAAATAAGMPVGLMPETATAASLVEAFPVRTGSDPCHVLAPLAELAGPSIVDGLSAKGYEVHRVTAYRTAAPVEPASVEIDPAEVALGDAVAFFSPSAVDRFVDRFGPSPTVAVCIGPSTAERANGRGFAVVHMADPHTEDAVIGLICSLGLND